MKDAVRRSVNLLWTGGLDSTYRLVELSREDIDLNLYYVVNKNRRSLEEEKQTMKDILAILRKNPASRARISPVNFIDKDDYEPIPDYISRSFKVLEGQFTLGSQYEWLANIDLHFPNLERSFERVEKPSPHFLDNISNADLILHDQGIFAYYTLSEKNSQAMKDIFGRARFPQSVAQKTKKELYDIMLAQGYEDIANRTWFCSFPYKGEPCGYCGPCRNVVKEEMAFRLPKSAMKRYRMKVFWLIRHKLLKIMGKI